MSRLTWPMIALAVVIAMQGGCGSARRSQRVAMSGRVKFEGKPLANGTILFVTPAGVAGREAMARITDGHYSIPRDAGPQPGVFDVKILGLETARLGGGAGSVPAAKIPAKYNIETTLRIVIPERSEMEYSFDLEGE